MCNFLLAPINQIFLLTVSVGSCLVGNAFQILSFVVYPIDKDLFYKINGYLAGAVWQILQYIFEDYQKAQITYSGDILPDKEPALLIANHRTFIDFWPIHSLGRKKHQLSRLKYFVKDSIKYLPAFGWGMYFMGQIFIKRDWMSDKKKIDETFATIKNLKQNVWIISYLEGSRITPEKVKLSQEFSEKRGYPVLDNVLFPRTKGFIATLHSFRGTNIKYVYDFTIGYRHKEKGYGVYPDIPRIYAGRIDKNYQFHLHVRRIPISSIPETDEEIKKWAIQIYKDKNDFLEELKANWTDNIELIDPDQVPEDIKKNE